ncbi:unnamed protein product [Rotaria sp. Silwood1]|nr:unnamed protein product [Rotaria sp. Silwood1]
MASNNDDNLDQNDSERDLYAILHISRDADTTTIQQAYRRLTLLYHPDKHQDLRTKQLAMNLFIQIKNAYDILNDPEKRAIYDIIGMKGLKTEGWEIITRTKTSREILDEYERLIKEREEKRFNQITNPNSSVYATINLTDIFINDGLPKIEITDFNVEQNIDISLTNQDTTTINANVTIRNGRGIGTLTTSFRRIFSDLSWFRIDLIFGQRPYIGLYYFRRITQKLHANVHTTFSLIKNRKTIITSGFIFSLNYQLTHNLTSSLQWKTGRNSFMKGILQYDKQKWMISSAIQLGFVNTFAAIDGVYKFPDICNLRCSLKTYFNPFGIKFSETNDRSEKYF